MTDSPQTRSGRITQWTVITFDLVVLALAIWVFSKPGFVSGVASAAHLPLWLVVAQLLLLGTMTLISVAWCFKRGSQFSISGSPTALLLIMLPSLTTQDAVAMSTVFILLWGLGWCLLISDVWVLVASVRKSASR